MRAEHLGDDSVATLAWLLELAARNAGYRLRGVRGWATASQIGAGSSTWAAAELMRGLARRELVLQEDVRAPGAGAPRWVYRISQRGVDGLAQAVGVWAAGIRDPEPRSPKAVLLADGAAAALDALRAAAEPEQTLGADMDRGGAVSARELRKVLERVDEAAERPARWFLSEDLQWLVRHGLTKERVLGRTHLYRITPAGAEVRPLEWVDPE